MTETTPSSHTRRQATGAGPTLVIVCLLVALTPLVFAVHLFEPYIAAKQIVMEAGTFVLVFVWLAFSRPRSLTLTPLWIPLAALILIGAFSFFWSSNGAVSLEESKRYLPYFLLFLVVSNLMQERQHRSALATTLILAGAIEALYVLLQYSFGDPFFSAEELRGKWQTFGTLGNPNWTGEFLAVSALVSLGRLVDLRSASNDVSPPWMRHLTLAALTLMLLALAATLARGAWLAFLVGTTAFAFLRRCEKKQSFRLKRFTTAAIAVVAGMLLILLPLFTKPQSLAHLFNLKSANGRIWMWIVTSSMVGDAPWFGHGVGTFGLQFPFYQAQSFAKPWAAQFIGNASFTNFAHNDHLQLWAELGVFAVVALGSLIWIILRRGWALAADPLVLGFWAAFVSLTANSLIAFPLHLPTTLMLFAVLAGVVEASVCKKKVVGDRPLFLRAAAVLAVAFVCLIVGKAASDRWSAETALWHAQVAVRARNWNQVGADARTAIRYAPTQAEGYAMLGRSQLERGDARAALESIEQAMQLTCDPELYKLKATALEHTGRHMEAIATLNELSWRRPDLQSPREILGALNAAAESQKEDER